MTTVQWAQIVVAIVVGSFTVIAAVWGVARSRMADQLSQENAFKLMRLELQDEFRKGLATLKGEADQEHRIITASISSIAEHKAESCVRDVKKDVEAQGRLLQRLESQITTLAEQTRQDFKELFELLRKGVNA